MFDDYYGIDPGNFQGKMIGPLGEQMIPSDVAPFRERDEDEHHFGKYDLAVEYENKKCFFGTLAQFENEFSQIGETATLFGDTKAHEDAKLRVLIQLALAEPLGDIKCVVSQPIKKHQKKEKEKIIQMLKKSHSIIINKKKIDLNIIEIGVSAEGAAAYWAIPKEIREQYDLIQIFDIGSGTSNLVSIYKGKVLRKSSDTFIFGTNTTTASIEDLAMANVRASTKLRWNPKAKTFVCGGSAYQVFDTIKDHYEDADIIKPQIITPDRKVKILHPVYANSVGNRELARRAFK